MNKHYYITAIAAVISLAFNAGAMAQSMSKDEYKAEKERIAAEHESAEASCGSLSGNAKDVCEAEAKGKEKVAKAELEARYHPTPKTRYEARIAKAEADYSIAKEKCDDKAGNVKDVCVKEAKAAETAAKADAKMQMKTTDAKMHANEESAEAHMKAKEEESSARKDAESEKRDADYAVAKEKCDSLAGDAKDRCVAEAKAHYGK